MPHPHRHAADAPSFVEAGVRFELRGDELPLDGIRGGASFGRAIVTVIREGRYVPDRMIADRSSGDEHVLTTGGARVEGRFVDGTFVGTARIARDHPRPREAMVMPVAIATATRLGGSALHAAVACVEEHAFVFVGPSGAGKSTACRLTTGARELAADRVLLVPEADVLRAFRVDAGEPSGLPTTTDGAIVRAILRVRHDGVRSGLVRSRAATRLADLRAAALVPTGIDESSVFERMVALDERTLVGTIYTRLDLPLDPGDLR